MPGLGSVRRSRLEMPAHSDLQRQHARARNHFGTGVYQWRVDFWNFGTIHFYGLSRQRERQFGFSVQ